MKGKDWFWSVVTLVVWYFFAYYALYALKMDVNLWSAAFWLLVLGVVGTLTCPWFQHTCGWKELFGGKKPAAPKTPEGHREEGM